MIKIQRCTNKHESQRNWTRKRGGNPEGDKPSSARWSFWRMLASYNMCSELHLFFQSTVVSVLFLGALCSMWEHDKKECGQTDPRGQVGNF